MREIHVPHGAITGVKDFLLHLFTITVGLLIALGLESGVEKYHLHERRIEAQNDLAAEIADNAKAIEKLKISLKSEQENLHRALDFLHAKEAGQPFDTSSISLAFSLNALHDANWRTASVTGALILLDYQKVQDYAAFYQLQEKLDRLQDQTFEEFLTMQSYVIGVTDPSKIPLKDLQNVEPELRHALAHLGAMQSLAEALASQTQTLAVK